MTTMAAPAMQDFSSTLAGADARLVRHSWTVAGLARRVAHRRGWDAEDLSDLVAAALLHDVGKVAIPEAVLDKPGPLYQDEWALVRRHPEVGARIVGAGRGLTGIAGAVMHHHERWDGSGYPDGLAGHEIPAISRLIAVCDAYCAMREERPYATALDAYTALEELWAGVGTQFDVDAVAGLALVLRERDFDEVL
jgi:putative nucleotidyltransferase with HDIG domain